MMVKVLYFAQVAEKTGVSREYFELDAGATSDDLLLEVKSKYPQIAQIEFKVAIDQQLTSALRTLGENCEVALLPPFAGG